MRQKTTQKRLFFVLLVLFLLLIWQLSDSLWLGRFLYPFEYQKEIYYYSNLYDVDPYLVAAIIYVESRFNPDAESVKGARGLMQLMPETGAWIADNIGFQEYDSDILFEPNTNIQMGAWYIANLFNEFGDNRVVVLAAYNGGRGRVKRWLESGMWDGQYLTLDDIPFAETRAYVSRVEKTYERYREFY